ncbi:unnamed protein product [Arabis nemorensis]|uniref:Uncharacterized protein n=1 Tax=Arabis nemorensis TaxID=586526 RepID=A0A565CNZ6_9BRAS|nr:unnamed protein product [Arabis nemorensis]
MMSVTQALKTFSDARPPGIYKPDYIDALYSFYHETKPQSLVCPTTPEWKRSDDLNREAVALCRRAVQENNQKEEMSNDDILEDEIPYNQEGAAATLEAAVLLRDVEGRRNSVHDALD